jgi:hypothetical protein
VNKFLTISPKHKVYWFVTRFMYMYIVVYGPGNESSNWLMDWDNYSTTTFTHTRSRANSSQKTETLSVLSQRTVARIVMEKIISIISAHYKCHI